MDRLLVGMDGSPAARHALTWSAELAQRAHLELLAARVFTTTQAELDPGIDAELRARQQDELEAWCAAAAPLSTALLLDGDPPDALLAAARDRQVDVLVVGGRGAGGFTHLHLGSVAHHLAHHTTIALAIIPATALPAVGHIVLGVDGSPGSLAAADLAADLAARLDVGVTAVFAIDPLLEWVPETDPRSWHHQADADVRQWAAAVDKAGVHLDVDIDRDIHPVAAIARALDAHPGSVACVGTRGLGGFSGLRLGRVPLQLVHHTTAGVILVPPESKS